MGLFWSKKLDVKFSGVFMKYKDTHKLSRTVQQYSPSACFYQNKVMILQKIVLIYDEPPLSGHLPVLPEWLLNGGTNMKQLNHKNAVANEHKI